MAEPQLIVCPVCRLVQAAHFPSHDSLGRRVRSALYLSAHRCSGCGRRFSSSEMFEALLPAVEVKSTFLPLSDPRPFQELVREFAEQERQRTDSPLAARAAVSAPSPALAVDRSGELAYQTRALSEPKAPLFPRQFERFDEPARPWGPWVKSLAVAVALAAAVAGAWFVGWPGGTDRSASPARNGLTPAAASPSGTPTVSPVDSLGVGRAPTSPAVAGGGTEGGLTPPPLARAVVPDTPPPSPAAQAPVSNSADVAPVVEPAAVAGDEIPGVLLVAPDPVPPAPLPLSAPVTLPVAPPEVTVAPPTAAPVPFAEPSAAPAHDARPGPPSAPSFTSLDEQMVRVLLDRYRGAFASLDVKAARAVWPSIDGRKLERAFEQLSMQELVFSHCEVAVTGTRAIADCSGTARYAPKVGNKSARVEPREWQFDLRRVNNQWRIQDVQTR